MMKMYVKWIGFVGFDFVSFQLSSLLIVTLHLKKKNHEKNK